MKKWNALAVLALLPTITLAQTLDQLEAERNMNQLGDAIDELERLSEEMSDTFRYQCRRALGASDYCECVESRRPFILDFERYVSVVVNTREALGYDELTDEYKGVVDNAYAAREACVSTH